MKRSYFYLGFLATVMLTACKEEQSVSLLERNFNRYAREVVDADLCGVVRVVVDSGNIVSMDRYNAFISPASNSAFFFEPGTLFFPVLLYTISGDLDTSVRVPVKYQCFGNYEVVDPFFFDCCEDSVSLRDALAKTSAVAIISSMIEHYDHHRAELLERVEELLGEEVKLPESIDSDSAFYDFCQGRRIYVSMNALLESYRQLLPTQIGEILPCFEDGVKGCSAIVVTESGSVNAMFLGVSSNYVGLVVLEDSKTYGLAAKDLFIKILSI